ncbi:MAG: hypothetical protein M3P98_03815 [bacterium]|nr:hypothetical protein [bacterium]
MLVTGAEISQDPSVYSGKASEILSHSVLSKTKLTVDNGAVEQGILETFPEVETVKFTSSVVGSSPKLKLTLSTPVLVMNSDSGQYLVNREGKVVAEPSKSFEELPQVYDRSAVLIKVGESTLRSDQVKFILEVNEMFEASGKSIELFELPNKSTNQVDAKLTGEKYIIKYSFSLDSQLQTGKYFALLPTIEQGSKPNEYVDLRVGERAYIK